MKEPPASSLPNGSKIMILMLRNRDWQLTSMPMELVSQFNLSINEDVTVFFPPSPSECPQCHMRYDLARGGCMHFRCTRCPNEFCSGCSKSFKNGKVHSFLSSSNTDTLVYILYYSNVGN